MDLRTERLATARSDLCKAAINNIKAPTASRAQHWRDREHGAATTEVNDDRHSRSIRLDGVQRSEVNRRDSSRLT